MSEAYTVLFLQSDPSAKGKERADVEYRDLKEALKRAKHREAFGLEPSWATRAKDLRRALLDAKDQGKLIVHFSSNNNGNGIVLEKPGGGPLPLVAPALARLMKLFEVSLVVLSGCYEETQAQAISEQGICVIGLKHSLAPETRIDVVTAVYDTLGSGEDFSFAMEMAQAELSLMGGEAGAVVCWPAELLQEESIGEEWEENDDAISDPKAYYCDRNEQDIEFLVYYDQFDLDPDRLFHIFILHGGDPQSHHGLFKRFYDYYLNRSISRSSPMGSIKLTAPSTLHHLKVLLKDRLFRAFNWVGEYNQSSEVAQLNAMLDSLEQRGVVRAGVEFRVRSADWKAFTPELLRWFAEDFLSQVPSRKGMALYLFFSVIYEKECDHSVRVDEIKSTLTHLKSSGCTLLKELNRVPLKDIEAWIEANMSKNYNRIKSLTKVYFPKRYEYYDMNVVEKRLNQMIENETPDS